jgi:hypothetical protein
MSRNRSSERGRSRCETNRAECWWKRRMKRRTTDPCRRSHSPMSPRWVSQSYGVLGRLSSSYDVVSEWLFSGFYHGFVQRVCMALESAHYRCSITDTLCMTSSRCSHTLGLSIQRRALAWSVAEPYVAVQPARHDDHAS